jgi:2-dehydro-3-deoxyphosphooctonate aldolase (KDO 8-P synthase)
MSNDTLKRIEDGEFFLLAGPCAVEDDSTCLKVAETVARLCQQRGIPYVFKASYKKANRLSHGSFATIGTEEALKILARVRNQLDLPVITDVHETTEVDAVAEVADILQIPAFLCRQTDLVIKAAATGKWINIKKGQFLAPDDMPKIAAKAQSRKVMLTERGTSFGYHSLVVDFRSLLIMAQSGYPVVYDATHSLQLPGGGGKVSTGQPQFVIPMARAAVAVGVNGLFVETHPDPAQAKSDAGAMLPLDKMPALLEQIMLIENARKEALR